MDRWTVIIIRRELGLDRPISASSNSLFQGLPTRLRQFGLQFRIISGILLLFVLVTCCNQFDLYLLSFSANVSTFNSSKFSSGLLWSKMVQPAALLKNFISTDIVGLLNNLKEV